MTLLLCNAKEEEFWGCEDIFGGKLVSLL